MTSKFCCFFLNFPSKMAILPNMAKTVKKPLFHYFFCILSYSESPLSWVFGSQCVSDPFLGGFPTGSGLEMTKNAVRGYYDNGSHLYTVESHPLTPPFSSTSLRPCRMLPRGFLHSSPPKNTSTSVACASACFPTLSDRGVVKLYFLVF